MTYKKKVKIVGFIDFIDGTGGAIINRTKRKRYIRKNIKYLKPYRR